MSESLREAARQIFATALKAVDVRNAVQQQISIDAHILRLGTQILPRATVDRVILFAMGKAAAPMYEAAAAQLASIPTEAVVVASRETFPADAPTFFVPGEHPTPGQDSRRAADAILALLATTTARDAVLFLVSGGASAMVEKPLLDTISTEDMATFHRALVGSGMDITQMNALRKHLSAVKGGRLAVAAAASAWQSTLLISDVPAAAPDAIASGPSLPDSTTITDCRALFQRLQSTTANLPRSITNFFTSLQLPETPKADHPAFARAAYEVILSSGHLAHAAAQAARDAGFHTIIDNTCDDWEYREAARYLLDRSSALAKQHTRICIVSVGEVSVAVGSDHGEGGRNTQFALWCAQALEHNATSTAFLSAGSDGIDGHSTAAGAVCDETTVARASGMGDSTEEALTRFNTAPLLRNIGDAITTGPTGNNLRDLRLILTA